MTEEDKALCERMRASLDMALDAETLRSQGSLNTAELIEDVPTLLDRIKELNAEVAQLKARLEWQPIETAPKDGREILILVHGMVIQARYHPGEWSEDTPLNPPEYTEYTGAVWCAFDDALDFEIEETPHGDFHFPVTHWMPLPNPPEVKP